MDGTLTERHPTGMDSLKFCFNLISPSRVTMAECMNTFLIMNFTLGYNPKSYQWENTWILWSDRSGFKFSFITYQLLSVAYF